jgi:hypothetical protein
MCSQRPLRPSCCWWRSVLKHRRHASETDIRSFAKFRPALTSEQALEQAKALARAERDKGG